MVVDTYRLFVSGQLSSDLMHPDTNLALVNTGFQPRLTKSQSLHLSLSQLEERR
jgi:hypothetical protein